MKSFFQGKKQLDAPALSASSHHASVPSAASPRSAHTAGGPNIEAIKEGDKVVRLVITCACGERLEVECLYRP